eukprot:6050446-Pyramimonas_sp.AAC.1
MPPDGLPRALTSFRWPPLVAPVSAALASSTVFEQCEHMASDADLPSVGRAPTRIIGIMMPELQ